MDENIESKEGGGVEAFYVVANIKGRETPSSQGAGML